MPNPIDGSFAQSSLCHPMVYLARMSDEAIRNAPKLLTLKVWRRERDSNYEPALKTSKLLIFQDGRNYKIVPSAALRYTAGTRAFALEASHLTGPTDRQSYWRLRLVAGACSVAIHNALSAHLLRCWSLPRNGRRLDRA